jgi:hypothetical protein
MRGIAADLIFLESGAVDGEIIKETETSITVKSALGTVEIARSSIKSIERGKSWADVYRDKWIAVDHKDPNARVELAQWAKQHGLQKEAEMEFQQILEIDPDNAVARRHLGFEKVAGKWVQSEEAMLARGMVQYQGRWMTPQEKHRLVAVSVRAATRQRIEELFHKMRKEEPFKRDALLQQVFEIRTPYAAQYIVKYVQDKNPALQEAATAALAKLKDSSVVPDLVEVAIEDSESEIRGQAAKAIGAIGDISGVRRLAPYLAHTDKTRRLRAAKALGDTGDIRAVPYLIEGLFVKVRIVSELDPFHKTEGSSSSTTTTTTTTAGGITSTVINPVITKKTTGTSISLGGESVEYTYEENKFALESLEKLTGQHFDYSKSKWRDWWEANREELLSKLTKDPSK